MPNFVKFLTEINVPKPELSAWLAFAAELGGGVLLIIGFLPRVAALAIAVLVTFWQPLEGELGGWCCAKSHTWPLETLIVAIIGAQFF